MNNINLLPDGGEVYHTSAFFDPKLAEDYLNALLRELKWERGTYRKRGPGKVILPRPRLHAWVSPGVSYTYAGMTINSQPMTPAMKKMLLAIEPVAGQQFDSALVNLYPTGQFSMSWHSDDEAIFIPNGVIASVIPGNNS